MNPKAIVGQKRPSYWVHPAAFCLSLAMFFQAPAAHFCPHSSPLIPNIPNHTPAANSSAAITETISEPALKEALSSVAYSNRNKRFNDYLLNGVTTRKAIA